MSGFNRLYAGFAGLAATLGVICSAPVLATPIVHNGATFEVQATVIDSNTAAFVYTADFAGWNHSIGTNPLDFIIAVDFKLSGYVVDTVDAFVTNASGNWVVTGGPSNANGCNGANGSFACAEDNPFDETFGAITAGILTWNFTVSFTTDVDPDDFLAVDNHIGAFFQRCADKKQRGRKCSPGLGLSQSTDFGPPGDPDPDPNNPVPVPGTLALFSLGMLGLGWARRRKLLA